jgi:hypothetical protein
MKKAIISAIAIGLATVASTQMSVAKDIVQAEFTAENAAKTPVGYRKWVFVGAPLTPNALNDGTAAFPEYHNVYVEPTAFDHFAETGEWPEGTQIVKELTLIYQNDNDELGATFEVSGHGYQQGEFSGLELTVKDSARFPDMPGGWAYFSFGHHAPPYAETASAFAAESCNACHDGNAETDFVFTQFYPVLRALQK